MCWDLNLANTIFEGDCLRVVLSINGIRNSENELNPILHDIRFMLQQAQRWTLCFIPRDVKQVAHKFAKLALSFDYDRYWLEHYPSTIISLILEEKKDCISQNFYE